MFREPSIGSVSEIDHCPELLYLYPTEKGKGKKMLDLSNPDTVRLLNGDYPPV